MGGSLLFRGGNMVTLEYIRNAAWFVWTRRGTAISRAFIKALGEKPTPPRHNPYREGDIVSCDAYKDLQECFKNTSSPLDRLSE